MTIICMKNLLLFALALITIANCDLLGLDGGSLFPPSIAKPKCSFYSLWKVYQYGAPGRQFYLRFENFPVGQKCQHRLVIDTECNKFKVKYISTDRPEPVPTKIKYGQMMEQGKILHACTDRQKQIQQAQQTLILSNIYSTNSDWAYQLSENRLYARFGPINGKWGHLLQFVAGIPKIWFD